VIKKVNRVKDVVSIDDEIEAKVIKIDTDERRIALSMRTKKESAGSSQSSQSDNFGGIGDIFDSALEGLDVPEVSGEKSQS
jgi:ribosomal protein S1